MLREKIQQQILSAAQKLGIKPDTADLKKLQIEYPEPRFGDYSSNAAMVLAKQVGKSPVDFANELVLAIDQKLFEKVEVVKPGFINFRLNADLLLKTLADRSGQPKPLPTGKILLEYFQPNIAKPLHVGHMRTAIIGDAIKRMLLYARYNVESDTHMGDWGTQFGYLILSYKKYGVADEKHYAQLNAEAEKDKSIHEAAKQEFVKLEQGDADNRKIWQQLVDESVEKFMNFANDFGLLPFENHWPESFYEDKMPDAVKKLESKKLLTLSQGAKIVDLEEGGLGVAIIIKSDGGTTYLLRDLATFIFARNKGFTQHLYVVDNRQALHYKQLFKILKLMGEMNEGEGMHIDYGFMSFKGEALSTRKGNMVLAEDLLAQAKQKVAKIVQEKNPDLKNQSEVTDAVAKAAIKFFDLSHNRHSDIEFDWDKALDFEGKSGPYIQYTYARLASILRKASITDYGLQITDSITGTERRILFLLSIFDEKVTDAIADYLPNIFADYLYDLATTLNRFYHESPVIAELDENKKAFRLQLVKSAKKTLAKGLDLLGIRALEEM